MVQTHGYTLHIVLDSQQQADKRNAQQQGTDDGKGRVHYEADALREQHRLYPSH